MPSKSESIALRLWREDVSLWPHGEVSRQRLGWLRGVEWMRAQTDELQTWAVQVREKYKRVIWIGMGGSSLSAAVFASLFAPARGCPSLTICDTTHPDDIARIADIAERDIAECLFIVAGKSGTTLETADLYRFFRAEVVNAQCPDPDAPDAQFVVITDPDTELARLPAAKTFLNPPDIGGRYAALSYFGIVAAAVLGVDIADLTDRAHRFCQTARNADRAENPSLDLGLLLGQSAAAGKDKLILHLPTKLATFGLWVEQLIAESTGKDGKGILPVIVDTADNDSNTINNGVKRADQIHIAIDMPIDNKGHARPAKHNSDYAITIDHPHQLAAEFFRWQFAVAVAASQIGVNPFDQPDVADAKKSMHNFLAQPADTPPTHRGEWYDLHCHYAHANDPANAHAHAANANPPEISTALIGDFCRTLTDGYLALLAYLPQDDAHLSHLQSLRDVAHRHGVVATLAFGPRYLHSTAQFHKGGPPCGRFIQFIHAPQTDLAIPQRDYGFAQLHRAQANGDAATLVQKGMPLMRVELKSARAPNVPNAQNTQTAMRHFVDAMADAMTAAMKTID